MPAGGLRAPCIPDIHDVFLGVVPLIMDRRLQRDITTAAAIVLGAAAMGYAIYKLYARWRDLQQMCPFMNLARRDPTSHIKTCCACRGSHKQTWGNFLRKPTSKARFTTAPVAQKGRLCVTRLSTSTLMKYTTIMKCNNNHTMAPDVCPVTVLSCLNALCE